jgi:beta-lactam-binding protein with PASTA domain
VADTTPTAQTRPSGQAPEGQSPADEQPPEQQGDPRPLWQTILAIAVLALLVGTAAYAAYALLGGAQVPDVVDLPLLAAQLRIEDEGLEIGELIGLSSAASTHAVVAQSPHPGTDVRRGSLVDLEVVPVTDWVKPPNVVSLQAREADETIRDFELVPLQIQAFGKDTSVGVVQAQLPAENVPMRPGQTLAYLVALGGRAQGIEVPLLRAEPIEDAVASLEGLGLEPIVLASERVQGDSGVVIGQLPPAGWFVAEGSPVALLVPDGN